MVDTFSRSDRLYNIRTHDPDFHAGIVSPAGESGQPQVLMGCLSLEELTALFFDGEGNLIDTQTRSLPAAPDMRGLSSSDPRFEQVVAKATQAWHDEMRFQPSVIKVRRFDHDGLKIEDLPDSYQEFISDPEAFELDEDERARWREQVTQWMNEGMFVLWWGKDYWINSAGEVDST